MFMYMYMCMHLYIYVFFLNSFYVHPHTENQFHTDSSSVKILVFSFSQRETASLLVIKLSHITLKRFSYFIRFPECSQSTISTTTPPPKLTWASSSPCSDSDIPLQGTESSPVSGGSPILYPCNDFRNEIVQEEVVQQEVQIDIFNGFFNSKITQTAIWKSKPVFNWLYVLLNVCIKTSFSVNIYTSTAFFSNCLDQSYIMVILWLVNRMMIRSTFDFLNISIYKQWIYCRYCLFVYISMQKMQSGTSGLKDTIGTLFQSVFWINFLLTYLCFLSDLKEIPCNKNIKTVSYVATLSIFWSAIVFSFFYGVFKPYAVQKKNIYIKEDIYVIQYNMYIKED